MIDKIKLHNYRQHKDTVIEFVPGINTIVGENNSGKSTIPEAIEFALYGSRALRDSAKGFITDGEADGSAIVRLELAGNVYTIGRNSKNAELRKNGELDSQYKDNVSREVCMITGVNQTGFRLGHYVRQKELSAFSNMRPGKRHETIEKMLKVHAIDKAIEQVKAEFNEIELKQRTLLNNYTDIDDVENELDDLYIVKQILFERGVTYEKQLSDIKDLLDSLREANATRIKALAKQEYNTKMLIKWQEDCTKAVQAGIELSKAQAAFNSLDWSMYADIKAKVDSLHVLEVKHAKMSSIKKELDVVLIKPADVPEPILPDNAELQKFTAKIDFKQSQVNTLKSLVTKPCCPTCNQPLDRVKELVESLVCDLDNLKSIQAQMNSAYRTAKAVYDKDLAAFKAYSLDLAAYNHSMIRRSQLLADYVEVNFSEKEMLLAKADLLVLQKTKEESIKLEGEITRLTQLAKEPLKPELSEVILGPDVTEKLANIETLAEEINNAFRTQSSELAHANGRIEELTRLVNKNKETKLAIDSNSKLLARLKAEQDTFTLFKRYLTAKIRPLLQDVAEALFHKVTKNRYAAYQLGSEYEISLTTHRGYIRKLSAISGSENDLACLCLRLAIATLRSTKLAGSLGFVILDEISGSFDDERTRQTLEGLLELKDIIPQIINITHKPVEMRFADRLFTVTEHNTIAKVSVQ